MITPNSFINSQLKAHARMTDSLDSGVSLKWRHHFGALKFLNGARWT
jgi:hypothetical protein